MEFLRDLTLTDKTKVFKTALLNADGDAQTVEGRASDDQRSLLEGPGVANFFLGTFLGCQLKVQPETATRDFFEAVEAFINEDVVSAEKRAQYQLALLSTMQDQRMDLRPVGFAESHIGANDRPALLERVTDAGLATDVAFTKDVALIEKKVRGFRIIFESGMTLVGTQSDLEERVRVRSDDEDPGADVNDVIQRLGGR